MLGERRSGREKEKYGGFEETGEWFLIKHGSSQFQYQRHSRQDVDTIGFIYFYRVSLSLFAHTILFHLLRRVHLLSHFLFLDPSHSRPFPPSPISRPFETFMTETDVTRRERRAMRARKDSKEVEHGVRKASYKGNTNGRDDRCSRRTNGDHCCRGSSVEL